MTESNSLGCSRSSVDKLLSVVSLRPSFFFPAHPISFLLLPTTPETLPLILLHRLFPPNSQQLLSTKLLLGTSLSTLHSLVTSSEGSQNHYSPFTDEEPRCAGKTPLQDTTADEQQNKVWCESDGPSKRWADSFLPYSMTHRETINGRSLHPWQKPVVFLTFQNQVCFLPSVVSYFTNAFK